MFLTYLPHSGVGTYLQKGNFSSSRAMFLNANLAPLIIFIGSESSAKFGSKHPRRTSRAILPIHSSAHLCMSLSKSFGSSSCSSRI
uniref:Cytochrome P450 CYP301A1 n=1 Tax=Laodelphax striatellus TaxID=195883 RepID=K4JQ99_LAOST|nr:cytochrome P450 CYP301A1 [Laodelphax striatellus]